jgi:hypothetical protein
MNFISLSGKLRPLKNINRYMIDWEKPSRSKFQTNVKNFLKKYWFQNVVFEEMPIVGTRMSLDLYNANKKIAIEVQGRQHQSFVKHFHGDLLNFKYQLDRDQKKESFCSRNGITLVTIFDKDVISAKLFEEQGVTL